MSSGSPPGTGIPGRKPGSGHDRHCAVVLTTAPVPEGETCPEGSGVPPLGLLYLAAALRRAGHETAIVDAAWEGLGSHRTAERLLSFHPRFVGITTTTSEYPRAVALLRHLKRRDPGVRCVIGGPHVSYRVQEALTDGFDAVVRGEGEEALVALAKEEGSSVPLPENVAIPDRTGAKRSASSDVASLPWPERDLVDLHRYNFPGVMITARGCPHGCYFCSVSRRAGAFRPRPEADVLEEAANLRFHYQVGRIDFVDDTFLAIPERAMRLGGALGKLRVEWAAEGRVDEILALGQEMHRLVDWGLQSLLMGIESGDDAVLRRTKAITLDDARRATALAKSAGIQTVRTSFIIGHPWDTEATIERTESFMLELLQQGLEVSTSLLTPYPGSIPGDRPEVLGLRIRSRDYERYTGMWALMDTPNLEAEWLQERYFKLLDRLIDAAPTPMNRAEKVVSPVGDDRLGERTTDGSS